MDFVDETGGILVPKQRLIAIVSTLSPCGVDVPWALMYETCDGSMPALRMEPLSITRKLESSRISGLAMLFLLGRPGLGNVELLEQPDRVPIRHTRDEVARGGIEPF